jgi:hypothetical protein
VAGARRLRPVGARCRVRPRRLQRHPGAQGAADADLHRSLVGRTRASARDILGWAVGAGRRTDRRPPGGWLPGAPRSAPLRREFRPAARVARDDPGALPRRRVRGTTREPRAGLSAPTRTPRDRAHRRGPGVRVRGRRTGCERLRRRAAHPRGYGAQQHCIRDRKPRRLAPRTGSDRRRNRGRPAVPLAGARRRPVPHPRRESGGARQPGLRDGRIGLRGARRRNRRALGHLRRAHLRPAWGHRGRQRHPRGGRRARRDGLGRGALLVGRRYGRLTCGRRRVPARPRGGRHPRLRRA